MDIAQVALGEKRKHQRTELGSPGSATRLCDPCSSLQHGWASVCPCKEEECWQLSPLRVLRTQGTWSNPEGLMRNLSDGFPSSRTLSHFWAPGSVCLAQSGFSGPLCSLVSESHLLECQTHSGIFSHTCLYCMCTKNTCHVPRGLDTSHTLPPTPAGLGIHLQTAG